MDVSSVSAQGTSMTTDQLQNEAQTLVMKKQLDVQRQQGQNAVELIKSANVSKGGGISVYA